MTPKISFKCPFAFQKKKVKESSSSHVALQEISFIALKERIPRNKMRWLQQEQA